MATVGALTNFGESQLTNYLLNSGNRYLALYVTAVTETGTGTEVTGTWYSRKLCTFTTSTDGASSSNNIQLDFGEVTGSAVTVTHWGLFDAATGGNMWAYGDFTVGKTASIGTNIIIPVGDIVISGN